MAVSLSTLRELDEDLGSGSSAATKSQPTPSLKQSGRRQQPYLVTGDGEQEKIRFFLWLH